MKFIAQSSRVVTSRPLAISAVSLLFLLIAPFLFAQQGNEKTFTSPGDAVLALYNAVKANDNPAFSAILGSNSGPIIHTGDDVADKKMGADFIRRYEQMHRVVVEPDQTVTLYIGADNWPMPIPLVKNSNGAWYFDTEAGKQEILYRRIGRNENDAIEVLHALVDAQHDYASEMHDGDKTKHYAMKFISDEGKQNGLYWKTSDNETPSPIGPLLVDAAGEGYAMKQGHQAAVPRVLLPHPHQTGSGGQRRRTRLRRERPDDPRLRLRSLSRRVSQLRRHDLHRQSGWRGLRKGPRAGYGEAGSRDVRIRS